jgi:Phosphoribosyl transferase domain
MGETLHHLPGEGGKRPALSLTTSVYLQCSYNIDYFCWKRRLLPGGNPWLPRLPHALRHGWRRPEAHWPALFCRPDAGIASNCCSARRGGLSARIVWLRFHAFGGGGAASAIKTIDGSRCRCARFRGRNAGSIRRNCCQNGCSPKGSNCRTRAFLWLRKQPRPDKLLTCSERWGAVRGAFATPPGSQVDKQRVLLLDDVMTTGATLDACAKALREAGASSELGLTIAQAILNPQKVSR